MVVVPLVLIVLLGGALVTAGLAEAQLAVSANDGKLILVNGVQTVVKSPAPDTVAIIDLGQTPPKILAEIEAPGSIIGPPFSVAITADEGLALVTSAMKVDPADASRQVPDNRLTVIDLKASPPAVVAQVETGKSPSGVSVNRQGTLALVANRADGTVSVFEIKGKTLTAAGSVRVGDDKSGPSHVAITPDGKRALVTRDGDHMVSVLSIDGTKVEHARRDLTTGVRPYGVDISPDGAIAVVGNMGRSNGDTDSVSVIDLRATPPRVVETVTVGQSPEGVRLSPDGRLLAVGIINGSNKAKDSPFYADHGKLLLYRVNGVRLTLLAEAPTGHWSQGLAFSADGKTILVQNAVEREIQVFRWDGTALTEIGRLPMKGGPAGFRTADK